MKNLYLKYVIKKPYLFFLFVVLGIIFILILLLTTNVPVINTYKLNLYKSEVHYLLSCDEPIFNSNIEKIYIYKDKNEAMQEISEYTVLNDYKVLVSNNIEYNVYVNENTVEVSVDIVKRYVNLFEKIFIYGGKN